MISLKNVSKIYETKEQKVKALNEVNLHIKSGKITGIIGTSGAGKSTLLRVINQLERQSAGEVFIRDRDVSSLSNLELRKLRQKLSMIFQHFNLLWSRTVKENIELPLEIAGVSKARREEKALELIDLVGLKGRENSYPSMLSGGQKQRVGIARALANNPDILLCDEATSALDPETTEQILDLLLKINREFGITIVLITHEMNVVEKICDYVVDMKDGRVVDERCLNGNRTDILKDEEVDTNIKRKVAV